MLSFLSVTLYILPNPFLVIHPFLSLLLSLLSLLCSFLNGIVTLSSFNSITYLFLPVPVTSPIFLCLYLCFYHQTLTPHYLYFISLPFYLFYYQTLAPIYLYLICLFTLIPLSLSNSYSFLSLLYPSLYLLFIIKLTHYYLYLSLYPHTS